MRTAAGTLLGLLGAALCAAQSRPADKIIALVKEQSAVTNQTRDGLMYTVTQRTYRLLADSNDPSEARGPLMKTEVWDVWHVDGTMWKRTVSKDGATLRDAESEEITPDFTGKLAELFQYELGDPPVQPDPVSGAWCWVIQFSPDSDAVTDGIKEELASKTSGIMYIDLEGFWVRYAEGELTKTFRKYVIGAANWLSFELEQTTDATGVVMPRMVTVRGRGSIAFVFHKRKEWVERTYSALRPLGPLVITPTPPP